jgi:hypothetical protein
LGQFEVRGLAEGTYGFASLDRRFLLLHEDVRRPGDAGVVLTAHPARSIDGIVVEAETGRPIPEGSAQIVTMNSEEEHFTIGAAVRDGEFAVVWLPEGDLDHPFTGRVEASAKGYRDAVAEVRYARGERSQRVTLSLVPIRDAEKGRLVVDALDARGRPYDDPLFVDYQSEADPGAGRNCARLERVGPGRHRVAIPAGRWRLNVNARHVMGSLTETTVEDEAVVTAGGETAIRVTLPAAGTLRWRVPAGPDGQWPPMAVLIEPVGFVPKGNLAGGSTDLTLEREGAKPGDDFFMHLFPPGTWRLELSLGREGREVVRTVVVRESEETLADFTE